MLQWMDGTCLCSNAGMYTTTIDFNQCDLDLANYSFQSLHDHSNYFSPRQAPNSNGNADTHRYKWDQSGGDGTGVPSDKYWWTLDGEDQTRTDANWLDWV